MKKTAIIGICLAGLLCHSCTDDLLPSASGEMEEVILKQVDLARNHGIFGFIVNYVFNYNSKIYDNVLNLFHCNDKMKFCIFASLYQILGTANVGSIDNIIFTSLNKEQKKKAAGVLAIFNVIIGSALAPCSTFYGFILDRWGEYDKYCAMIAYKNYFYVWIINGTYYNN